MAGALDVPARDGFAHGAAVLAEVRALGVAAFAEVRRKVREGVGEVAHLHEVKAHEVQHAEAGRVGDKSAVCLKQLDMAGGVPAALNFLADAAGRQRKGGEQQVEQRGLADAGRARKRGGFAREVLGEKGAQRRDLARIRAVCAVCAFCTVRAARVFAETAQREGRESALFIQRGNACAAGRVQVAFGDDEDRQDAAVHADGAQLVQRGKYGRGLCRGGGDEQDVQVCHRRANQQISPRPDGLDVGVAVFLDAQHHIVAHLGRDLCIAERAARPRRKACAVCGAHGVFAADALDDFSVCLFHIS